MFMQTHQYISYLKEVFQNIHSRFLDVPEHLQNHSESEDDTDTTIPRIPTRQDHLKRNILSGLGGIVMPILEV